MCICKKGKDKIRQVTEHMLFNTGIVLALAGLVLHDVGVTSKIMLALAIGCLSLLLINQLASRYLLWQEKRAVNSKDKVGE